MQPEQITVTIEQLNLEAALGATLAQRSSLCAQLSQQLGATQQENAQLTKLNTALQKRIEELEAATPPSAPEPAA